MTASFMPELISPQATGSANSLQSLTGPGVRERLSLNETAWKAYLFPSQALYEAEDFFIRCHSFDALQTVLCRKMDAIANSLTTTAWHVRAAIAARLQAGVIRPA